MLEIIKKRIKEDYRNVMNIAEKELNLSQDQLCLLMESVDLLVKDIKDNTRLEDNSRILEDIEF